MINYRLFTKVDSMFTLRCESEGMAGNQNTLDGPSLFSLFVRQLKKLQWQMACPS